MLICKFTRLKWDKQKPQEKGKPQYDQYYQSASGLYETPNDSTSTELSSRLQAAVKPLTPKEFHVRTSTPAARLYATRGDISAVVDGVAHVSVFVYRHGVVFTSAIQPAHTAVTKSVLHDRDVPIHHPIIGCTASLTDLLLE